MKQELYSHRDRARLASVVGVSSSWIVGPSQQLMQESWPVHTLLVPLQMDSIPSPQGRDTAVEVDGSHMIHARKQNKEVHSKSETEKDVPA